MKKTEEQPEVLKMEVSRSWIRFIRWVQENYPHGQVCFKTVNGEPTDFVEEHSKRRVRFDKEETIPLGFFGLDSQ